MAKIIGLFGVLVLLSGIGGPEAHAQALDSTVHARVERAVHGADGEGRDGPMAKLDRGLISLYYEYRAYQQGAKDEPFSPSDDGLAVQDAHVTIDAIAVEQPEALLDSLRGLGLQKGARAERLVSGRLPIEALRRAAGLSLLQSMRAAQARTRTNTGGMLPAPPPDANVEPAPDTTTSRQAGGSQPDAQNTTAPTPESEVENPTEGSGPSDTESEPAAPAQSQTDSGDRPEAVDSVSSQKSDSAAVPAPASDTADGASAAPEEDLAPGNWMMYAVGGVVALAVGLLLVLRQQG